METEQKGKRVYQIGEKCNSCGACKVVCPVHCIRKGEPYVIMAEKCIGCGKCTTRCWRGLITPASHSKS